MHLLGDFVLQTKKMVLEKKRLKAAAWQLYVHCVLHGVLIYIIMPGWTLWQVPLIVSVSHFFIDWWKLNRRDTALYFIADQALHLLVLVLLWQWFFNSSTTGWYAILRAVLDSQRVWVVTAGYLLISFPLSYLLAMLPSAGAAKPNRPMPCAPPSALAKPANGSASLNGCWYSRSSLLTILKASAFS